MKLHQGTSLIRDDTASGVLWGFLLGLLFLKFFVGIALGVATGVLAGQLSDYGIDDAWIKEVASSIPLGGSALFVMARNTNAERALPEMAKFGGRMIRTNLTSRQQQELEDALAPSAARTASVGGGAIIVPLVAFPGLVRNLVSAALAAVVIASALSLIVIPGVRAL